jgi:hypothetical protein
MDASQRLQSGDDGGGNCLRKWLQNDDIYVPSSIRVMLSKVAKISLFAGFGENNAG